MANLTKTQIRKRIKEQLDKLFEIKTELESIKDDVEEESSNIEPYENKDDLTPQQEERQEWLDDVASELENLIDYMDYDDLVSTAEIEMEE